LFPGRNSPDAGKFVLSLAYFASFVDVLPTIALKSLNLSLNVSGTGNFYVGSFIVVFSPE